jgi:hypothetical protein
VTEIHGRLPLSAHTVTTPTQDRAAGLAAVSWCNRKAS